MAVNVQIVAMFCYLWLRMARMEMDCNLKKLAIFFKFLLSILKKLLKTDYNLVFLGAVISYFPPGAVRDITRLR